MAKRPSNLFPSTKKELKFSYKEERKKYKDLINSKLKEIVVDNIVINGLLEKLNVPGIYVDQNGMEVLLIANGKLSSTIRE